MAENTDRIEVATPEEARRVLPNMLGAIAEAMLREHGIYKCRVGGRKTDIVVIAMTREVE